MAENTVTFSQGSFDQHTMRPMPIIVEIDGLPAPWLELTELIRNKGPKLNCDKFQITGGAFGSASRFEEMAAAVQPGQRIRASMICMADNATGNQITWPLFSGRISDSRAKLAGTGEEVEIIASDSFSYQDGKAITGTRVIGPSGEAVYLESVRAVFNQSGKGNASKIPVQVDGKTYTIFDANEDSAAYWTYSDAIKYIVAEYYGSPDLMAFDSVKQITDGQILRDMDVTGLSPLEAIDRLCERAGLGFYAITVPGSDKEILQFYQRGRGKEIFLKHQKACQSLDVFQTNILGCSVNLARANETIRAIGRGDLKQFEATFELTKGWPDSLEINDYKMYSPITNENFIEVQDVFRKWVLNEAGNYTDPPYNRGATYDLSKIFGTNRYSRHRRRFRPCLSRSETGKSMGYFLEISYNNGNTYMPYTGAFDILLDQCGVYLTSNQFDTDTWNGISKNTLRLRITASVVSDEPLTAIIADGPVDSSRRAKTMFLELGTEFKYRQVTPLSIFHNNTSGQPDTIDDSENLRGRLRDRLRQLQQQGLAGKAKLNWVHPDIWPGDIVSNIDGRKTNWRQTIIEKCPPQINNIEINFGKKWFTTIAFGED